ncbi:MAG TPA: dienelactone hydrolase family protein [Verrucomicrobiae bacterium]|nr:dienelactone hydrolase family protein [Verrucomicrobiae bacterium]
MNRLWLAGIMFVAVTATAQDWAKARLEKSPRHLEWVTVKQDNREVKCFIAYPEVKGKATAVVVIHEIFGLTDWVRGVTDQLAEAGYIAIAPDLLSGASFPAGDLDAARKAISTLPPDQITADLNAVTDYVSKLPSCNGKVVVAGFCWGGGQAFRFATNNKDIKATFSFYGPPPDSAEAIARINCPVYGFYGGNDNRIGAMIPKAVEMMKAAGKTYEPVTYEGAGHGFMRAGEDPTGNEANKKAREAAWARWLSLLKKL